MFKKAAALLIISIFTLNVSLLYPAETVSLDSLLRAAVANNPEILAARKRWESALTRVPRAKTLEDPSVNISFERTPKGPFNLRNTPSDERMISISQVLPLFGKLSLKGKIAVVEGQIFAGEYRDKQLEIINAVKNTYYDLFMNDKEIELNQESLELLKGVAKVAEAKYTVGQIQQEELAKINLEIAKLSTDVVNLKQEKQAKEARMNGLLNRSQESPLGSPVVKEDLSFHQDINSLYKLTLENQPELLIFSSAIEKSKYAKSLAKRSFFPDLMAQIAERGITTGTIGPWDLALAFTVPLWFWTKQRYEVKEAIANLEEAQAAYTAMKNKALSETKNLFTRVEVSRNKINLYKNNLIPILESSLGSSLAGFRSGKGDFMAFLDTQRMFIETRLEYYRALAEYNTSLADLERNLGIEVEK